MPLTDADATKVAKAVVDSLTYKVTKDQWAAKEGIFEVGQELDPRAGLRQVWAYGKDTNRRIRQLEKTVAALVEANRALSAALAERNGLNVDELVQRVGERVEAVLAAHDAGEPRDDVGENPADTEPAGA